jgi:hypothetical protein
MNKVPNMRPTTTSSLASLQSATSQSQLEKFKTRDLIKPNCIQSLSTNKSAMLKQTSQIKGQLNSGALLKG